MSLPRPSPRAPLLLITPLHQMDEDGEYTIREIFCNGSKIVEDIWRKTVRANESEAERYMWDAMYGKVRWDTMPFWAKRNVCR